MLRFIVHVISGTLGAGISYAAVPMFLAMGINAIWPFGLDAISTTQIKLFCLACVAILVPMTAVAIVRSGRQMFFARTDGRPALFGRADGGLSAERRYKTRSLIAITIALLASVAACLLAVLLHRQVVTSSPIAVLYLCLLAAAGTLVAGELNDLRRTIRLTL